MNERAPLDELGREETIFNAAVLLRDPAKQAIYLDLACENNPPLRARIEKLLASDVGDEFFAQPLPKPVLPSAATTPAVPADAPAGQELGERIGRYKLLQKIGEGGLGLVYMAEQEEPVRRRVALKIIRLGMDTRSVIARFEAERQALAMMDHPNIAKILDGGVTETGRPYFVMDLVQGLPITQFCDEAKLSTRGRLELFGEVCSAIQHAHQKGIIHRDIKPSNILVTLHGEKPVPKVIDFGIAKATQQRLTDKTLFTQFQHFIGTPAYMSPEQASLSGLDIDTRSDVYSLGVLLYELLTGKTPFDSKELLQAGVEEMCRTIREKEPARPSTRLSTLASDELTTTARLRGLEAPKLISTLRGDLDWIAMKCLEKDRARRYETTNGLAMDIQRHLNNEPVVASPPGKLYRLQKLVRRNRLLFTAIGLIVGVLALGAGVSTWQALRATRAEHEQGRLLRKAQTEAAKSKEVAQFLKDMLAGVGPSVALGRDTTMLKEILDKTAERVGKELTNQPEVALDLRGTIAATYWELGLYKEMEDMALGSVKLARTSFGVDSTAAISALENLGLAQYGLSHFSLAEATEREALSIRRKLGVEDDRDLAGILNSLGLALESQGKLAEAEATNREALAIFQKVRGKDHLDVAMALYNLGNVLGAEDKLDQAVATHREVLAMRRELLGKEHPDVAASLHSVAIFLGQQGKFEEAETMLREVVAMLRKLLGPEHRYVAASLCDLATALRLEGKLAEAEAILREALPMVRKTLGNEHADVAATLDRLALVLRDQGKLVEAEAVSRECLALNQKLLGYEPYVAKPLNTLVTILRREGKLAEVEMLWQEQVTGARARLPADAPELASELARLVDALLADSKFSEAEPPARECLTIREKRTADDWTTFNTRSLLGASLLGQQKYSEAEPLLLSGYEGMKQREAKIPFGSKPSLNYVLKSLVQLYDATGRSDEAAKWKKKLEEFEATQTSAPQSQAKPEAKPPP